MKEAMVSELKAQLSKYLARVRKGETVIVRDRKIPVAKLTPYEKEGATLQLTEASLPPAELAGIAPVELLKDVDAVSLLREEREAR
jgi:prevent-host-death family protein